MEEVNCISVTLCSTMFYILYFFFFFSCCSLILHCSLFSTTMCGLKNESRQMSLLSKQSKTLFSEPEVQKQPPKHCSVCVCVCVCVRACVCVSLSLGSGPGCISHSQCSFSPGTSCLSSLLSAVTPLCCRDSHTQRTEGLKNVLCTHVHTLQHHRMVVTLLQS